MACVIVYRIFIFLHIPYSVIPGRKHLKKMTNVFVQTVYFNTYNSVYVLDFYTLHYFSIMIS